MKYKEKIVLVKPKETRNYSKAKDEVFQYDFNGFVDFSDGPTMSFNPDHNIVIPSNLNTELYSELYINGKHVSLKSKETFLQCGSLPLTRVKTLQRFFDHNKDAQGVIFFLTEGGSIFHEGNVVRPCVVE